MFIYCDNCFKSHKFNYIRNNIKLTCQNCNYTDTYILLNSYFYSFFISKNKLNLYNINLDKKQEYNSDNYMISININQLQRKKSTTVNLDYLSNCIPKISTFKILNKEPIYFYSINILYIKSLTIKVYNVIKNFYIRYYY